MTISGWHESPQDERDFPLSALPIEATEKPEYASLQKYVKEVLNQKDAPVCVAASICAAFQSVYGIKFSMRWLYWQAKKIDGLPPNTDGTTFRAALQVVTKQGLCPEEFCPTFPNWKDTTSTPKMEVEAAKYKLKSYARLTVGTLEEIEKSISQGYFVLLGAIVDSVEWMNDEYLIKPEGAFLGGHAILGFEYDEAMKYLTYEDFVKILNSWGTDRGRNGYYYMAEAYAKATQADLAGFKFLREAWAIEFFEKLTPELRGDDALLIGIDPGHGGSLKVGGDPGAIGKFSKEKDITLAVSLHLDKALKRNGFATVMTRTTDKTVSLEERTNLLKAVDFAVSVHVNSSTSPDPDYVSTFIYAKGGEAEKCAELVQKELVAVTGWEDGGVRTGNLHMVRETKAPAILTEAGFISNPAQEEWLNENPKKIAEAICKGVCSYYGKNYKEEAKVDECSVWAREARDWAKAEGITDGTDPKGNVTREQVWVMLYRMKEGK